MKGRLKSVPYIIPVLLFITLMVIFFTLRWGDKNKGWKLKSPSLRVWSYYDVWSTRLPEDMVVIPPVGELKELTEFSGKWKGKWNQKSECHLVVKKIKNNRADIYYGWSASSELGVNSGAVELTAGFINKRGKYILHWSMEDSGNSYSFWIDRKTGRVKGKFIGKINSKNKEHSFTMDMKRVSNGLAYDQPGEFYKNYRAVKPPEWVKSAVVYHLFPRIFSEQRGFQGLKENLPYLKELGINTICLMPPHEIGQKGKKGSLGSPYSVKDYYSINRESGTKEDFKNFVDEAHNRGFRIIIDWVANHTSRDNPLMIEQPQWYAKDFNGNFYSPTGIDWTDVVQLNYKSKELRDYMIGTMKYWVKEFSIDGFRCDAARRVPVDFWEQARKELKRVNKHLLLISESEEKIHNAKAFDLTYEGGIRSTLRKIIHSGGTQEDFHVAHTIMNLRFPRESMRMHWIENHRQRRAISSFGRDEIYPVATILLTLEGVPLIFMGQEFGDESWNPWISLSGDFDLQWGGFNRELFFHYKKLINLRTSNRAFTHGKLAMVKNNNPAVVSYVRYFKDEKFLVMVNLSGLIVSCKLLKDDIEKNNLQGVKEITNLMDDKPVFEKGSLSSKEIKLQAFQGKVYALK